MRLVLIKERKICDDVSGVLSVHIITEQIRLSQAPIVLYKAFVGKGNNSILIKNAIKNRFWWNIVAEKSTGQGQEVNFVWSQQRDN